MLIGVFLLIEQLSGGLLCGIHRAGLCFLLSSCQSVGGLSVVEAAARRGRILHPSNRLIMYDDVCMNQMCRDVKGCVQRR